MSERFSLKCKIFESTVLKYFNTIRDEEDFCDVTLVCDDQQSISAHKMVLAASSQYFRKVLKSSKHPHPILCLDGISYSDLNNIVDFIYNGEITIQH